MRGLRPRAVEPADPTADEPDPWAAPLPATGGGLALLAFGALLAALFASVRERT